MYLEVSGVSLPMTRLLTEPVSRSLGDCPTVHLMAPSSRGWCRTLHVGQVHVPRTAEGAGSQDPALIPTLNLVRPEGRDRLCTILYSSAWQRPGTHTDPCSVALSGRS